MHGGVNRHNFVYWSDLNPQWFAEEPLHSPKVVVWATIGVNGIIGPYFFDENVNQECYLHLLQTFFLPQLQALNLGENVIFQQDGAPPHWGRNVCDFLNETFPN